MEPILAHTKSTVYDSQLVLYSDIDLLGISTKIKKFNDVLREYTGKRTTEPWAFLFEPDGESSNFSFERRANVPFKENQFFSKAALSTSKHMELLQEFERIMH
jgi:hypothetical protein